MDRHTSYLLALCTYLSVYLSSCCPQVLHSIIWCCSWSGLCVFVCSGISCMAQDCSLQMPEDFVLPLLPAEELKDKYRRYLFRDYVEVCVCVCVWVSRLCSYGHWEGRGMWERCEIAAVFLSRSESLNLLHTFRPSASFPLIFTARLVTPCWQQSDHNTNDVQLGFIPLCNF